MFGVYFDETILEEKGEKTILLNFFFMEMEMQLRATMSELFKTTVADSLKVNASGAGISL